MKSEAVDQLLARSGVSALPAKECVADAFRGASAVASWPARVRTSGQSKLRKLKPDPDHSD